MSAGAFYVGLAQLSLVIAAFGFVSFRLRARLLPAWNGAPARLVESVTGVGLLVLASELLGVAGLLRGWALVLVGLLLVLIAWLKFTPRPAGLRVGEKAGARADERGQASGEPGHSRPPLPPMPGWAFGLALATTALLVAQWAAFTTFSLDAGIGNFDSVWYHLPFSADMFQTGSSLSFFKTETVFANWFYPQNSELIHADVMALTDRDFFSVFLNMGWLAMALLAAWCVGRPYGRPHLSLIAATILLSTHTLVSREPGTAKNDIMAIALILSAVSILVNRGADPADGRGRIGPGWAMATAGLAAGLAAGTKFTSLAPVAMITFAALFAAHHGTRLRSAAIWFGSGLVGGGFWYLRNLVATGNPIPQIRNIGPIELPGPDRLQQGRPDFNVFHYATDTEIWREYFVPGLERGFGELWPLLLAVAVVGLATLIWRGPGRLTRAHGFAALLAIVAYVFTPLSAAGPDGSPDAFAINLRFLVPALAMALVLIPLLPWFAKTRFQIGLVALMLVLFFVGARGDEVWSQSGRYFGTAFALALVVLPALIWLHRDRLSALIGGRPVIPLAAAAAIIAGLAISWPLANHYFDSRYNDFEPEAGLAEPYRWANGVSDAEIGLAGTTAGFRQYGFFGEDLSNRLTYIGSDEPAGGFDVIRTCPEFKRAVNEADLDYLVTSPFLNFNGSRRPIDSPEATWVADDKAISLVVGPGSVEVWRVEADLDPDSCDPDGPGPESTPGLKDRSTVDRSSWTFYATAGGSR